MFPGATADREAASYVVIGAPLDATTSLYPGTRFGPDRIRRFAAAHDDYHHQTESRFSALGVCDAGDVSPWDDVRSYLDHLAAEIRSVRLTGGVPMLLGGEHTVTLSGVEAVDADTLVVVDAHLDLRERYDDTPWSHACVTRRALEIVDRVIIIGARTGSAAEWERAERDDVEVIAPADVGAWLETVDPARFGAGTGAGGGGGSTYLSVDIDGADAGVAPGTGTMEPFGLDAREMRAVVRTVAPHAVGFDVVEVNDRDAGQAAALAGRLLREFVHRHAAAHDC